jgi:putative ABC transport system permease protein
MLTFQIAFRNILRQKRRSLLTGLSITGGYMLTVLSYSLVEGSYDNVIDIFTLDNSGHIQIHKDNYLDRPKIYKTIQDRGLIEATLKGNPEINSFTPRVFSPALAYAGNKTAPSQVIGVDADLEPTVSRLLQKVAKGTYFSSLPNADGHYEAMIGRGLHITLKLNVGDEIVLISLGADGSIANDIFVVSAIIGNKTSFDRMAVYLPLNAAQEFLSLGNDVHEYVLLVNNKDDNEAIANELSAQLTEVTVSPWQVVEAFFYRTMQADKQGNYFTMGLLTFIVFIGVLNTVLMSILERTREFGVLRAIGSRPMQLVRLITLETFILAFISVMVGFLLILPIIYWSAEVGMLLPEPIDVGGVKFHHLRGAMSVRIFWIPMVFMLATAVIISLPPGFRAARILPKEAMGSH